MPRFTQEQYDAYVRKRNQAGSKASSPEPEPPPMCAEDKKKRRSDFGTKRPRDKNTCIWCGKEFFAAHSFKRKYCSPRCAYSDPERVAHIKPKERGTSKCENCGQEFAITVNKKTGRFCSQRCAAILIGSATLKTIPRPEAKRNVEHICGSCGKPFKAWIGAERKYCSNACAVKKTHPKGRYKSGWIQVGGKEIYVRSQWEANYAFYLEFQKAQGLIKEWEFEPETFWFHGIKRGVRSYLPDFRITTNSSELEYHELKGWMNAKSATKIKRMAKYHPTVTLIIINSKRYQAITKTASSAVSGWGTIPNRTKIIIEKISS